MDMALWLAAWNRYFYSRLAANPSMALELVKYQTMMVMFFMSHPPSTCIEYDRLFRQAAAQDHTIRWDSVKNDIYVWAVTQSSSQQFSTTQRTQSFRDKVYLSWPAYYIDACLPFGLRLAPFLFNQFAEALQ